MSNNSVMLLGTKGGPAVNPGGSMPTSCLLSIGGRLIVVDCGLGVTGGIAEQGVSLKSLDLVFITHLHSDHYLEFGPLLHTAWTAGLSSRVTVYGPEGLQQYWQQFLASMQFDIDTRIADEGRPDLARLVTINVLDDATVDLKDGLSFTAMRNVHPPVTESFALRFDDGAGKIVFSGDTAFMPEMADFAKGANLLVHEAMHEEGVERLVQRVSNTDGRLRNHLYASHTKAGDVGHIASKANVEALAIYHMVPADDPEIGVAEYEKAVRENWKGPLHIGQDGMKITF